MVAAPALTRWAKLWRASGACLARRKKEREQNCLRYGNEKKERSQEWLRYIGEKNRSLLNAGSKQSPVVYICGLQVQPAPETGQYERRLAHRRQAEERNRREIHRAKTARWKTLPRLRRPTRSQERTRKKRRRPAALGMTGLAGALEEQTSHEERKKRTGLKTGHYMRRADWKSLDYAKAWLTPQKRQRGCRTPQKALGA